MQKKKIFIIAGETSGDLWGARLVEKLFKKKNIQLKGLGGNEMKRAGLKSIANINPLSIMGLFEVLKNLPSIYKIFHKTMDEIKKFNPDIVLTIDSPGFNFRIAKAVRKYNPNIKLVHFVAPQVWAWKEERAKKVAKLFDHLLCFFPFEVPYFKKHGLACSVVGHPILENGVENGDPTFFREKYKNNEKIITLLPGSRLNEVERLLPILLKSAEQIYLAEPDVRFVIPTVSATHKIIKNSLPFISFPLEVIKADAQKRYDLFAASTGALASSGSVSLELAVAKVPHCICYKFSPLTYFILKRLVKTKFANLINIVNNREIIPEFIQKECRAENLSLFMVNILINSKKEALYKKELEKGLKKIGDPSHSPTDKIIEILYKLF